MVPGWALSFGDVSHLIVITSLSPVWIIRSGFFFAATTTLLFRMNQVVWTPEREKRRWVRETGWCLLYWCYLHTGAEGRRQPAGRWRKGLGTNWDDMQMIRPTQQEQDIHYPRRPSYQEWLLGKATKSTSPLQRKREHTYTHTQLFKMVQASIWWGEFFVLWWISIPNLQDGSGD